MNSEEITAVITGAGVLLATGVGVASIIYSSKMQKKQFNQSAYLQELEHRNEQARRIGDWLSKTLTSVSSATTLPEILEPLSTNQIPLPDYSKINLGLIQQLHQGQLLCVSLVNDKVAILATSQEIKDAELRQAINNVANDVGIIATTFIEYRNKLMSFDLKNSSPSELIDKFMPEMRNKVDALYKSCNSAAAKLEKFLSETPLRPND